MTMTIVKERPIIFSGPMVNAIIDGTKTQTRRVIKPQPSNACEDELEPGDVVMRLGELLKLKESGSGYGRRGWLNGYPIKCPYGVPGDRLWVRETWNMYTRLPAGLTCRYKADDSEINKESVAPGHLIPDDHSWRRSIHMYRWASRITLEITDVRVERLHDISEADARAEGCPLDSNGKGYEPPKSDPWQGYGKASFCLLWSKIYAQKKGKSWESNPWVWAVSFRRVDA